MLPHLSKTPGISGIVKSEPEDFIVEEVTKQGRVLEVGKRTEKKSGSGIYTHFILQKKNWNTAQAIKELARALRVSQKRLSYAGTKDRKAVTTQLCSAWKIEPHELAKLRIKDLLILGAWKAGKPVPMGDLKGNRFTIRVRGVRNNPEDAVKKIRKELGGRIPNYFGEQRFGSLRANTHLVGRAILKADFREAVMNYLTFPNSEEMEEAGKARKRLAREKDFAKALANFPHYLKYERTMLHHLAENPRDFIGALRKLPRGVLLMFVHAYQSHIFNEILTMKIRQGKRITGKGKLIGYQTRRLSREEKRLLQEEGVSPAAFRVPSIPEISSKGTTRDYLVPLKNFSFKKEGKDGLFRFTLQAGAYATIVLREFLDEDKA